MNHLGEGTIHAWLDGALDAAQSREIEAHVAGCAACSAAVAEARGLIAGASRILGALDDVPGGVIPRGGSAAPGLGAQVPGVPGVTPISSRRDAPRRWRITRWASGIAAVLVAAIVLSTAPRVDRSTDFPEVQKAVVVTDTSVSGATGVAATQVAADEAVTPGTPVTERRELASSAPPAATPAPASGGGTAGGPARRTAGGIAGGIAGGRASDVATTREPAANQARQAAPTAAEPSPQRIQPSFGEVRGVAQRPAPTVQQDTARMRVARVDSTLALESVALTVSRGDVPPAADVNGFAGCYRLEAARDAIAGGVAKGAGADAQATRRRTAAERTERAAAPSAAAAMSDVSARGLPAIVRLDTARSELGYAVRVPSDSTVGSWRIVGDSARLELGARGVVMLSPARRVSCP